MGPKEVSEDKRGRHDIPASLKTAPPIEAEFDSAYALEVQTAAQEHRELAMDTLADLARGHKSGKPRSKIETTPATRRHASNDLIGHGFPRSVGKQADLDRALAGGIHITVIQQAGEPVKVEAAVIDVTPTTSEEEDEGKELDE